MNKTNKLCAVVALLLSACASHHGQEVRDARMEQVNARQGAQTKAVEEQSEAQKKSTDRSYDARNQRISDSNQPTTSADTDLDKLSKERADGELKDREQLNKLGVRLDGAKQKLAILGGRAPSSLESDLQTAQRQYSMLDQEIGQLNSVSSDQWEAATKRVDQDMSTLDTQLSQLTSKIEDAQ